VRKSRGLVVADVGAEAGLLKILEAVSHRTSDHFKCQSSSMGDNLALDQIVRRGTLRPEVKALRHYAGQLCQETEEVVIAQI